MSAAEGRVHAREDVCQLLTERVGAADSCVHTERPLEEVLEGGHGFRGDLDERGIVAHEVEARGWFSAFFELGRDEKVDAVPHNGPASAESEE